MDSECWKPLCFILLWGKPCYILSVHYHSNLNAALKYLRLVGAHFKHFKEIQRLMCQRSSAARGRMPWREHLNKTVHEMSNVEMCRHCCSWKFMRTRSRLWHSVIFFPWQSSWWLLEYWPIMSKSSNEVKLCHLPRSPWKCCPVAQPDARVRSFP